MRESGKPLDLTTIDNLMWNLIMLYDRDVEFHERNLRLYAKSLFEVLASRGI